MANCNKLFLRFNEDLNITSSKSARLVSSKDSIKRAVRDYLRDNHPEYFPEFFIQGSYKLSTMIRTKDDTCDVDLGVYFKKIPDVKSYTMQSWIYDAVDGLTKNPPLHKNKCITVDYQGDYNIDLPVYFEPSIGSPKIAVRDGSWLESDVEAFETWFNSRKDPNRQLRRIVKYLKAWCDNIRCYMPTGLTMTVLASESYIEHEFDDVALLRTLERIKSRLRVNFICTMPVTPYDDLLHKFDHTRRTNFLNALDNLIADGNVAMKEANQLNSSKLWKKHLGERFPLGEDENVDEKISKLKEIMNPILGSAAYTSRDLRITNDSTSSIKNKPHKFYGE
ncbi:MAG: hypothetical protein K1X85_05650 [Ignavibacteria bacterium]|nr:hypothetical protein [Ignavibacteria bacterium]